MEAKLLRWNDLKDQISEAELGEVSNNGVGREQANYLVFYHDNKIWKWYSDAMEPEDARFTRNLRWIGDLVIQVYEQGLSDYKHGFTG